MAAAVVAIIGVSGCSQVQPEPIALGKDACDQCRMTIADARFGGEAITSKGRILRFDSVECLAAWSRSGDLAAGARYYVIDLQHPGTFVRADSAGFLRGVMIGSPMGGAIVGFVSLAAAEQQRAMLGGEVVTWEQLRTASKSSMGPS
jgi:copper chaperone NosL